MSILEICDKSDSEVSQDIVSLGKARSMILADNALIESPFTNRDIFTQQNNTQSDLSVVFANDVNELGQYEESKYEHRLNSYDGAIDIEDQVLCIKNMFEVAS